MPNQYTKHPELTGWFRLFDVLSRFTYDPKKNWREYPCMRWDGFITSDGYGRLRFNGKKVLVHRLAYERCREIIPSGLEPDHLCRNRACFCPAHMEIVTKTENIRRGISLPILAAYREEQQRRTHCIHGHLFDDRNTGRNSKGNRYCRECKNSARRVTEKINL